MNKFIVTEKAQRPASEEGICHYCQQKIGQEHKPDCVLIQKKVKVKLTVEYEIEVPSSWNKDDVEFHRNQSSWCADNLIKELEGLIDEPYCLCHYADYEYIEDTSEPLLDE